MLRKNTREEEFSPVYCPVCGVQQLEGARYCISCGHRIAVESAVQPEEKGTQYAGFWLRLAASVVDGIILLLGSLLALAVTGATIGILLGLFGYEDNVIYAAGEKMGYYGSTILGIVGPWLYYTLLESSSWQATPGKKAVGIMVTDSMGKRISLTQANVRYWGKQLSWLTIYIGFIMAGFTKKKQALHDIIAGTLVVRREKA